MEHLLLYSLDEIDKVILYGLKRHGQSKTFAQLLADAGVFLDANGQVELAINLEALELIECVSYNIPIEIRAELSPTGRAIAAMNRRIPTRTPSGMHMLRRQSGFPTIGLN